MPETSLASVGATARLAAWLNGLAALMIAAFALGIIGGDTDPPDLDALLDCFLAGLAASGLAALCAALAQSAWARSAGRRCAAVLAALALAASLAAFGAGCWLAVGQSSSTDDSDSATNTVYAIGNRIQGRPDA
jgi:hypothetical protein